MTKKYFHIAFISLLVFSTMAFCAPFSITENLFNQSESDLGLSKISDAKTFTVFKPTSSSDHYGNGVVVIGFKGNLYCQWQSSETNEDSEDTWVAYSISEDEGETWSEPKVIAETINNGYRTSGGWIVYEDTLIAFINEWPNDMSPKGGYTYYTQSTDGIHWSEISPVLMKDGSPMNGVFEQDPHLIGNRMMNAAHFQPGLLAKPIYTDDLSGRTGWVIGNYTNLEHSGSNSREMEPSLFVNEDNEIIMTFRDQNSTYYRMASKSSDNGNSWSTTELTNMPDSRAKQSAGNLPDKSAYLVGNPVTTNTRIPLSITLSSDGKIFDKAYNLRVEEELPDIVYEGTAKRLGYHYPKSAIYKNYLYVSYATNKELIEITKIPLEKICNYVPLQLTNDQKSNSIQIKKEQVQISNHKIVLTSFLNDLSINKATVKIFNVLGHVVVSSSIHSEMSEIDISNIPMGKYILQISDKYTFTFQK